MKITKLIGNKYQAGDFSAGDVFEFDRGRSVVLDFDDPFFTTFFSNVDTTQKRISKDFIQSLLTQYNIPIDVETFSKIFAYQYCLDKIRHDNYSMRTTTYEDAPNKTVNLSYMLKNGMGFCTERSTLTQMFMQRIGIKSQYIGGNMFTRNFNALKLGGEGHAYNVIRANGHVFVYDSLNPIRTTNKDINLPAIFGIDMSREQQQEFSATVQRQRFAFIDTVDIYGGKTRRMYGIDNDFAERNENGVFKAMPLGRDY